MLPISTCCLINHVHPRSEPEEWISPARKLPSDRDSFDLTIDPADLDNAGVIYFNDPAFSTSTMSFVASRVEVQLVSGPKTLFFDFVGK